MRTRWKYLVKICLSQLVRTNYKNSSLNLDSQNIYCNVSFKQEKRNLAGYGLLLHNVYTAKKIVAQKVSLCLLFWHTHWFVRVLSDTLQCLNYVIFLWRLPNYWFTYTSLWGNFSIFYFFLFFIIVYFERKRMKYNFLWSTGKVYLQPKSKGSCFILFL